MNTIRFVRVSCLALAAALLAACSTSNTQVRSDAVLRVGVCPDYQPVIFKKDGAITGIEADLAKYVAQKLGASIEYVELPFDELIPALGDNRIDIVMSGMSDADYRKDKVRFVEPYMTIGQMGVVRKADDAKHAESDALYEGEFRVGYLKGTTGEMFVKDNAGKATLSGYTHPDEGIAALKKGEIDIFIDDAPFVLQVAKDNPELAALQWLMTDEHLAWALSKDPGYDDLYDELNRIVLRAKQNGDLRRIVNKYFEVRIEIQ
ncbi:amino acid ABC transporter substrate-binding protein [bacterium]|nr:amino acid ABC transporter substrate-binding protein [bacterium]